MKMVICPVCRGKPFIRYHDARLPERINRFDANPDDTYIGCIHCDDGELPESKAQRLTEEKLEYEEQSQDTL